MRNRIPLPSAEVARSLFAYNSESGVLTHKVSANNKIRIGAVAGTIGANGYRFVRIGGERLTAHRVIWLIKTGGVPTSDIDHINGVKDDNRWKNLRLASRSQNRANCKAHKNNSTKIKGVQPNGKRAWKATIMKDGISHHLGTYPSKEQAGAAYIKKATELFGEFAVSERASNGR